MESAFLRISTFLVLSFGFITNIAAQNRNFIVNLPFGVGNSGFKTENESEDEIKRIFYPTAGLQVQKRISSKWAINIYPNVGMSGNRRILSSPLGNITEVKSTSAFVNLSLHPKYYLNESFYCSLGPEVSYLLWNYGSSFIGDERQSNIRETKLFNRTNLLLSSSIGLSKRIGQSRKNAIVEIDVLWFLELRAKQGITNILKSSIFGDDASSTIFSLEIVTGISFASKD